MLFLKSTLIHVKKVVKAVIIAVIVCLAMGSSQVQAQTGITSVPFLRITPDALTSAMGSTGVTYLRGSHSGWWNPSLLGWQEQSKISLTHANWLPSLNVDYYYDHLGGVIPSKKLGGAFGVNITYFNLGGQLARDAQGFTTGSFTNYETALSLTYGRRLVNRWAIGGGASYIHSSLASGISINGNELSPGQSVGIALGASRRSDSFDLGRLQAEWRFGSSLTNLGSGIRYFDGQSRAPLPFTLRAGVGGDLTSDDHRFTLSADVSKLIARTEEIVQGTDTTYAAMGPVRALFNSWGAVEVPAITGGVTSLSPVQQLIVGVGIEYGFQELFFMRTGYYHENPANGDRQFWSLGAGIQIAGISVDMSYLIAGSDSPINETLRFTLSYNFGGKDRPVAMPHRSRQPMPVKPFQQPADFDNLVAEEIPVADRDGQATDLVEHETQVAENIAAYADSNDTEDEQPDRTVYYYMDRFETLSSQLTKAHKDAIVELIIRLQQESDLHLQVIGYTDNRGSDLVNKMLSEARARAILLEILSYGITNPSRVNIEGRSWLNPIANNDIPEGRHENRRVEVIAQKDDRNEWLSYGAYVEPDRNVTLGVPLNSGTEIRFNMLQVMNNAQATNLVKQVVDYLEENTDKIMAIVSYANYAGSSSRFIREIQKARSELFKEKLIRNGVAPHRIIISDPSNGDWLKNIDPDLLKNNSELIWFIPGS